MGVTARFIRFLLLGLLCAGIIGPITGSTQDRVAYNYPELIVDLGVGLWAWPMPIDYDSDGDWDLLVSCPDVPFNGTYLFENTGGPQSVNPIFKAPVRIGKGLRSPQISYTNRQPRLLTAGLEWTDFLKNGLTQSRAIYPTPNIHSAKKIRANQWKYADYDGDGDHDLIVGVGDWTDYGWDNAYDKNGKWTNGPLRGWVYLIPNVGSDTKPKYGAPAKITAEGKPVEVYGMPSPCLDDFDGDGDLDLLCGEFLDGFSYFENIGSSTSAVFTLPRRLANTQAEIRMDLQMITPVSVDWDHDGDVDLICGDEDGRVALIEHTGLINNGVPQFRPPRYFKQYARDLKFGALVTPVSIDWDADGDEDLVCGNTAGNIAWIENRGGGKNPSWEAPKLIEVDGQPIRIMAGRNGSIQGPAEAKWGYTTLSVADWDHDGLLDLIVNSIWGKVIWFRNQGTKKNPVLAKQQPIEVQWDKTPPFPKWNWWKPAGNELVTQWRTTPVAIDLNRDQMTDLVMLDHEGFLAFFERKRQGRGVVLLPPQRVFFDEKGNPLRLNSGEAGRSGRRKICIVDWDADGKLDLLVNSQCVDFFRNVSSKPNRWVFKNEGPISRKRLAGHTTSPTVVDWDEDGRPELLVGAEDGFMYYFPNPNQDPAKSK